VNDVKLLEGYVENRTKEVVDFGRSFALF